MFYSLYELNYNTQFSKSIQKPSKYTLKMGLSKKRKQQLSQITICSIESQKRKKVDKNNQQKKQNFEKTKRKEGLLG